MAFTSLRPQDLVVCLKLAVAGRREWTYAGLTKELSLSMSGTFNAVSRARQAGLIYGGRRAEGGEVKVARRKLVELCSGALQAMFFPVRGEITRGIPTSLHAPSLKALADRLGPSDDLVPLVWPDPRGQVRGETLKPIHASAVKAALCDPVLYELLALVDVVRIGKTKERKAALGELEKKIMSSDDGTPTSPQAEVDSSVLVEERARR